MNPGEDVLADLEPDDRKSEQTRKILAMGEAIRAAKDRKCSWRIIAKRLERSGIRVSGEQLRIVMTRYKPVKSAGRKRAETSAIKKPAVQLQKPVLTDGLPEGARVRVTEVTGIRTTSSPPVVRHAGDRFDNRIRPS